jgi:hypothetical protein
MRRLGRGRALRAMASIVATGLLATVTATSVQAHSSDGRADAVLLNGFVYTVDAHNSVA